MLDSVDKAMCDRARGRFDRDRARSARGARRLRNSATPNLIVIGGLKCATTSIHHYLSLHPEIQMSRPKELNYFVEELNGDLGSNWYQSHFDRRVKIRGETSPHYTNLPYFDGVAERMRAHVPEAKLIYMVRDPIERIKSHWRHCRDNGYETRPVGEALSSVDQSYYARSKYWTQLEPFAQRYPRDQVMVVTSEELKAECGATMASVFSFLGVDPEFSSDQFARRWQTSRSKASGSFARLSRIATKWPFREVERSIDRTPEGIRWRIEEFLLKPNRVPAPTDLPPAVLEQLRASFGEEVAALEAYAGRSFEGWGEYRGGPGSAEGQMP